MKADNLGIEVSVKAKMTVDKQTAEGCLYLVQIYCNDTGARVRSEMQEDGTRRFSFIGHEGSGEHGKTPD